MKLEEPVAQLLKDAQAARHAGDSNAASRCLDKAREQAPGNPMVLNASGMHMLAVENFADAQKWFAAATVADPNAPALFVNMATAFRGMGDDDGERHSLQAALALERRNFIALLRLTELDQRQGHDVDAALGWRSVVQLASAMPEPSPVITDALQRGFAFLEKHAADLSIQIEDKFGAQLAAMGTAARRVTACLDHSLGRRSIYANQCEGLHFPFLPADEFFERRHFPWLASLEENTAAIRREAIALLEGTNAAVRPYVQLDPGTPKNKWTRLDRNDDWSACFLWEYGIRNDEVCDRCPITAAAIAGVPQNIIPGKAPTAFFSILKPKSHIPAHTGVTNTRAIIHLPLIVPDDCRFRVGGETRQWREGEAFAFDDTIEHEAWNDSEQPRIVLIFDVWNPHMTADECKIVADFLAMTSSPPNF